MGGSQIVAKMGVYSGRRGVDSIPHSIYVVIGYHVTLSEGHMIANHPI